MRKIEQEFRAVLGGEHDAPAMTIVRIQNNFVNDLDAMQVRGPCNVSGRQHQLFVRRILGEEFRIKYFID